MLIIIPKDTFKVHIRQLDKVEYYGNFSLLFRQYVPWRKTDYKFNEQKWENFERFHFEEAILTQLHNRNELLLSSFQDIGIPTYQFSMHTSWRLITGIGASSSLEVGMILHHIYGIPYIPSSSLKGLLRYYLNTIDSDSELDVNKLLGTSEEDISVKGQLVLLDAFPEPGFKISVDIMNNHYQDYYMGDKPPADWMDPNPVKFLTVKDATFVFRLIANDNSVEGSTLEEVAQKLAEALTELGIGAKTAVGYGRFKNFQKLPISKRTSSQSVRTTGTGLTIADGFNFYDPPDGTKEYYLKRLEIVKPFSDKIQWLFQKWERDEQWKNDPEIARAFLPKIKKEKKSGKETHFYKVIKSILNQ